MISQKAKLLWKLLCVSLPCPANMNLQYLQALEKASLNHMTIPSWISSGRAVIFHDVDDFIKIYGERAVFLHTGSLIPQLQRRWHGNRTCDRKRSPPCVTARGQNNVTVVAAEIIT